MFFIDYCCLDTWFEACWVCHAINPVSVEQTAPPAAAQRLGNAVPVHQVRAAKSRLTPNGVSSSKGAFMRPMSPHLRLSFKAVNARDECSKTIGPPRMNRCKPD